MGRRVQQHGNNRTLAVAKAVMKVADTPRLKAIPSPMIATTDIPLKRFKLFTVARASSSSKLFCSASRARWPATPSKSPQIFRYP